MVKLGRLVLNKGKWNGKQLISKSWIEESTRQHILTGVHFFSGSDEELGYGYQWWTGHSAGNNRKVAWTAAIGNGGQRIYVVPELDMTVVMTAGDYGSIEIHRVIGKLFDAIVAAALPNSTEQMPGASTAVRMRIAVGFEQSLFCDLRIILRR